MRLDGTHNFTGHAVESLFPEPRSLAETGINQGLIADLVIKTMYFTSYMSGQDISSVLRLPYYGVLDQVIVLMKKEQLCEVSGTSGLGEAGYQYVLTIKGMERAHQVLERSSYVGACPVPLGRYIETLKILTSGKPTVFRDTVENALRGMMRSVSASTPYSRLSDVGIELKSGGKLEINATKMDAALDNLDDLKALFTSTSSDPTATGFGWKIKNFAEGLIDADGTVSNKTDALKASIKRNSLDQDRVNDKAARTEKRLLAQYNAMDAAVGSLNGLSAFVSQQIILWNKS